MQSMDALESDANLLDLHSTGTDPVMTYLLGDIEVLDVQHNEVGLLLHMQIDGDLAWPDGNKKKGIKCQTIQLYFHHSAK